MFADVADMGSSTCGRVLKTLSMWTMRTSQIVRAVRKSGSVQVRGEERSPVSRMRRAVKIRIVRKVDRPRRRTDATMYSP